MRGRTLFRNFLAVLLLPPAEAAYLEACWTFCASAGICAVPARLHEHELASCEGLDARRTMTSLASQSFC